MSKKKTPPEEDYLRIAEDYQAHKYLPGYFTGGRIDPFIRIAQRSSSGSRAASRLGYAWLVTGAFTTILAASGLSDPTPALFVVLVIGLVQLAAGIRVVIIRRQCKSRRQPN